MNASSAAVPFVSDLVLIGGGHAHVHVLKMLGMPPWRTLLQRQGIRITLIAKDLHTPYSGMLPGYVSGHYSWDDIHLDCQVLARFCNARLIHASATRITYNNNNSSTTTNNNNNTATGGGWIEVDDGRPPVRYDCLSIDIGSAPAASDSVYHASAVVSHQQTTGNQHQNNNNHNNNDPDRSHVIPVKPIVNFTRFYEGLKAKWEAREKNNNDNWDDGEAAPYTICVAGGGAGGIELALSLHYKLWQHTNHNNNNHNTMSPPNAFRVMLVTRGDTLLESHNAAVQRMFRRILRERHIGVLYQADVVGVKDVVAVGTKRHRKCLILTPESAQYHPDPIVFDDCIWCVTAGVSSWLASATPFATTEQGFVRVNDTYECIHHPGVFAAGDCCHMDKHPRPKGRFGNPNDAPAGYAPYLPHHSLSHVPSPILLHLG